MLLLFLLLWALFGLGRSAPQAAAQSVSGYDGEYFANLDFAGTPTLRRVDPDINFDWGQAAPGAGLSAAEFSVRWTRWYDLASSGSYSFTLTSDDGSRLWVDGTPVIDLWYDHPPLTREAKLQLMQGYHLIRVEYYQNGGGAVARLQIQPEQEYSDWKGEYFTNPDLAGAPAWTTNDAAINFDWGASSPDLLIPADHFSARWTRKQHFESGTYRFTLTTDDGSRLYVGDKLLIDQWHGQPPTRYTADLELAEGDYVLRLEHYEATGAAQVSLNWTPVASAASAWAGRYYANSRLSGEPVLVRQDAALDFDWDSAGPGKGLSGTDFSARWEATRATPRDGFYTVYATADDGVRVSVDGQLLIDEFHDQPRTAFAATVYLASGEHRWQVDYYQHFGGAALHVALIPGVGPPRAAAGADIAMEEGAAGWAAGGDPAGWRSNRGETETFLWTPNRAFSEPGSNWGRWYPALPAPGNYEVLAHIPAGAATTRSARYWIWHGGNYALRTISQAVSADQWLSLGTYYFDASGSEYVLLSDITYECEHCYNVVWDAVKFSPR